MNTQDLKDTKPKNGSYLIGLLEKTFPNRPVIDAYVDPLKLTLGYPNGSIIYVDDELFINGPRLVRGRFELLEAYDHHLLIVKLQKAYQKLSARGYPCVLFPWWHVVDDVISLHLLQHHITVDLPNDRGLAFSCFNRRWTPERQHLIDRLDAYGLLASGWVTAAGQSYRRPSGVRPADLEHYQITSAHGSDGWERHQSIMHNIPISATGVNALHISSHHKQPIVISSETSLRAFFPSEKSFLGFTTKRLPIILAEPNRIEHLRQQGFDLFDDIIDHGYDYIENIADKIEYAIKKNLQILQTPVVIDDNLCRRLEHNFEHLTNTWLDAKLTELIGSVQHLINTWRQ